MPDSNMEDKKGEDNNAQKKCDNPMIKDGRFNMRDDLAAMVFCCTSSSRKTLVTLIFDTHGAIEI